MLLLLGPRQGSLAGCRFPALAHSNTSAEDRQTERSRLQLRRCDALQQESVQSDKLQAVLHGHDVVVSKLQRLRERLAVQATSRSTWRREGGEVVPTLQQPAHSEA